MVISNFILNNKVQNSLTIYLRIRKSGGLECHYVRISKEFSFPSKILLCNIPSFVHILTTGYMFHCRLKPAVKQQFSEFTLFFSPEVQLGFFRSQTHVRGMIGKSLCLCFEYCYHVFSKTAYELLTLGQKVAQNNKVKKWLKKKF